MDAPREQLAARVECPPGSAHASGAARSSTGRVCRVAEIDGAVLEGDAFGQRAATVPMGEGETVLLAIRPHNSFFMVYGGIPAAALLLTLALLLWSAPLTAGQLRFVAAMGALPAGALLLWSLLEQRARLYVLTDRRVIRRAGTLRPTHQEIPLAEISRADASWAWGFGAAGSVLLWADIPVPRSPDQDDVPQSPSADTAPPAMCWEHVPDPAGVAARISDAVRRYGRRELP